MTQIISVISNKYVLLAADRRLTFADGPRRGQVAEDNECKLVSLCHAWGIGYSGLARLDGKPTHRWIATTLAAAKVYHPDQASEALLIQAQRAVGRVAPHLRSLTFVIGGWACFDESALLCPHFCVVSNALDDGGRLLEQPASEFRRHLLVLRPQAELAVLVIGEPLAPDRQSNLKRNLTQLITRGVSPAEAVRLLVKEIEHTHRHGRGTVGGIVLTFCVPRLSAERHAQTGFARMLNMRRPVEHAATFGYFDGEYDTLRQHAPTLICGELAAEFISIENDPSNGGVQKLSFRMLVGPPKAPSGDIR
jgi:hypothetical protein